MKIEIGKRYAALVKDDTLIEKSKKLYLVEFTFDESWAGFAKTATFQAGDVTETAELIDDRCIIPSKCLETAGVMLRIGVSGAKGEEQKDAVWCLTSRILYATDAADLLPPLGPVTPGGDVTAQILEVIRENTATDEEVDAALDEAFDSSCEPGGGTSGSIATDEEVEDVLDAVFGEQP